MKNQVQYVTPRGDPQDESVYSKQQKLEMSKFWAKLQLGDLCFLDIVKYGIALFGQTKAGKTTLAHHLAKNTLVSRLIKDTLGYVVDDRPARLKEAIIGLGNQSETQIPNECITELVYNNQKIHLFDCPGFSDSKGSLMIVTNGYFHYRIFSKVQNLKFVLTFDGDHFKSGNTFQKAANTIIEFFNSFRDINAIKQQIFAATSFFFTKVQDQDVLQLLKNMKTAQFKAKGPLIVELIDHIITKNKFHIFKRAQKAGEKPKNQQFLKKIHETTEFWSRKINQVHKQVDMSQIQISIGSRIALLQSGEEEEAARKFQLLSTLFSNRFIEAMGSSSQQPNEPNLKNIIQNFWDNSLLGKPEVNQFYSNLLVKFVNKYYIYDELKQIPQYNKKQYHEKRNKAKKEILSFQNKEIEKCQIEWIQKLQISRLLIQFVQECGRIQEKIAFHRQIESFKETSNKLLRILVQIKKIRFFKNNSADKITYINDVQNFCYIIYRLIEEAKTFKIIFANSSDQKGSNQFIRKYDVTHNLVDTLSALLNENVSYKIEGKNAFQNAKLNYISTILQIKQHESLYYYNQIQKYCKGEKTSNKKQYLKKMTQLNNAKVKSIKNQGDNSKINSLIDNIRHTITELESSNSPENFEQYIGQMNELAYFLSKSNKQNLNIEETRKSLKFANRLYKYVNNVHRVLLTYEELIKLYDEEKDEVFQLKDILIECGQYASSHGRREVSLRMFEHAYHLIDRINIKCYGSYEKRIIQRGKIAEMIGFTGLQRSYNPAENYYDNLLMKRFCQIIQLSELQIIEQNYPNEKC